MRNFIVLLLLFILPTLLFSKDLSVFKGMYVEGEEDNLIEDDYRSIVFKNVTYQYYENENDERIFNGFFKINENTTIYASHLYLENLKIEGQYLDGYKNGVWKISADIEENSEKYRLETSAEYLNGKLNGNCIAKRFNLKSKKSVLSSTASFKNNLMIGRFFYSDTNTNIEINVNFNDNGLYDGDYIVKFTYGSINYEDKRKYENGILKYKLYRNMNNGNIIFKYDSENVTKKINNLDSGPENLYDLELAFIYWTAGGLNAYNGKLTLGDSLLYIVQRGIDPENLDSEKEEAVPITNMSQSDYEKFRGKFKKIPNKVRL